MACPAALLELGNWSSTKTFAPGGTPRIIREGTAGRRTSAGSLLGAGAGFGDRAGDSVTVGTAGLSGAGDGGSAGASDLGTARRPEPGGRTVVAPACEVCDSSLVRFGAGSVVVGAAAGTE